MHQDNNSGQRVILITSELVENDIIETIQHCLHGFNFAVKVHKFPKYFDFYKHTYYSQNLIDGEDSIYIILITKETLASTPYLLAVTNIRNFIKSSTFSKRPIFRIISTILCDTTFDDIGKEDYKLLITLLENKERVFHLANKTPSGFIPIIKKISEDFSKKMEEALNANKPKKLF